MSYANKSPRLEGILGLWLCGAFTVFFSFLFIYLLLLFFIRSTTSITVINLRCVDDALSSVYAQEYSNFRATWETKNEKHNVSSFIRRLYISKYDVIYYRTLRAIVLVFRIVYDNCHIAINVIWECFDCAYCEMNTIPFSSFLLLIHVRELNFCLLSTVFGASFFRVQSCNITLPMSWVWVGAVQRNRSSSRIKLSLCTVRSICMRCEKRDTRHGNPFAIICK